MEPLRIFHNPELMAKEIALQLKEYADQAEKDGNIFSIVLSGEVRVRVYMESLQRGVLLIRYLGI